MNARTKLMYSGVKSLSNAELLSLAMNIDENTANGVLDYAKTITGGLDGLAVMDSSEFMDMYGIGESKTASLISGLELAKRIRYEEAQKGASRINDTRDVARILMAELENEKVEHFVTICLNSKMQIISKQTISIGSIDYTPVHPREVFAPAIKRSASAIIVGHNHPSGDTTPSEPDIEVTRRLLEASEILGIRLLDHVIVGNQKFTSMKAEGYFYQ